MWGHVGMVYTSHLWWFRGWFIGFTTWSSIEILPHIFHTVPDSMGEFHSNSPSLAMKTEWSRPRQIYLSRKGQSLTHPLQMILKLRNLKLKHHFNVKHNASPGSTEKPPEYPASSNLRLMSILMWVVECKMLLKSTHHLLPKHWHLAEASGFASDPLEQWRPHSLHSTEITLIPRIRQQRQQAVA